MPQNEIKSNIEKENQENNIPNGIEENNLQNNIATNNDNMQENNITEESQEVLEKIVDNKDSINQEQNINKQIAKESMKLLDSIEENISEEDKKDFGTIKEKIKELENNSYTEPVDFDEMYRKLFKPNEIKKENEKQKLEDSINLEYAKSENTTLFENIEEYKKPAYKFVGIAFNTYIIIEMKDEIYIIDQHAAHERIMYEKVKKNYYSENSKNSQMLLLPDIITLTHKEMDIAKENMEMFKKAGFDIEEFGENTIKLVGVPPVCIDLNTKELFLETLDEINTVARTAKQEKEEKFIATVACKSAVKAHMALTKEEVASLMDKLLELPNPFTCPHGRPTAIKMTKYEIERKFARK